MQKILTVVMPSYNAESYLNETVPTILSSSLIEDIELIIVNDGSRDSTLKIAKAFEDSYPNSVRVIDKENGGHGSAINIGIQEASGKYFKIIDADDWVDTEAFDGLIGYLKKVDVDQVISPYTEVYINDNKKVIKEFIDLREGEFDYNDFLSKINFIPQMHSLTISTKLLKNNNINVDEKMFYVDTQYIIYPMPFVSKVAFWGKSVYQYRLGTVTQSVNINSYIKNREMLKHVVLSLILFLNKNENKLPKVSKDILQEHLRSLVSLMVNIYLAMSLPCNKSECINFIKELDSIRPNFIKEIKHAKVRLLDRTNYFLFNILSFYTRKYVYKL